MFPHMVYVFILLLALCLVSIIAEYSRQYSRKKIKWLFVFMIIALAGIGACVEPKETYDLFRHYEMIDRVRGSSYSLGSFLVEGYKSTDGNYKYTYVYNIFVYIVAKCLPNQSFPLITIAVTYSLFTYILFRELEGASLTNRNIIISCAIFSVLMPYLYVYSGIRNALAASIVSFGIYRLYKDKKVVIFIECTVIAVLIHPAAAAIVPFILLSRIKPGIKGIIITLAAPSLLSLVMEYFRLQLGNDYLFRIAAKYYNYTMVRVDNQGKVFLYSTILILVILAVLALCLQRRQKKNYSLLNLIIWYAMFSLGYVGSYEMMTRLPYSIAFLSPVIVNTLFNRKGVNSLADQRIVLASTGLILVLAILGIYENIAWMM